jgi:hypothetical protein
MRELDRILDLLPPPYAVAADATLPRLLDAVAIELEVLQEDLDRMQRTHWVNFAYALGDLARLADSVGVEPLPGETVDSFRARLIPLVRARLDGAVGPGQIRAFVRDYLQGAERALRSTFVPALGGLAGEAPFGVPDGRPNYRPLALVENPERLRRSASLAGIAGRVPYLHRWEERNDGLADTVATFAVTGFPGGRTAVPLVVNLTTGDLIGYAGVLRVGRRLTLEAAGAGDPRLVRASLDGDDVTGRVFSVSGFRAGVPFEPDDLDPAPLLPRLARGPNRWVFLSVGLFDVRGLNHVFYAIAGDDLREGEFDDTFFDRAVFPSGPVAGLEMAWTEVEPASFEVRVPWGVVAEAPELAGLPDGPAHDRLADALSASVDGLRAAGVRARVVFEPFTDTQPQSVRATLPWVVIDPERGPLGGDELELGARFGESALDRTRFD